MRRIFILEKIRQQLTYLLRIKHGLLIAKSVKLAYRKHVKEQNYENESMDKKLWLVNIAYKDYKWLQFLFLLLLLNILIGKNFNDHDV